MLRVFSRTALALAALIAGATSALAAQKSSGDWLDRCNNDRGSNNADNARHCEVRQLTMAAPARTLRADGGRNGGVSVVGENRRDISVEARIEAHGDNDAEARDLLSQIRIDTTGGSLRAEGPPSRDRRGWAVSFAIAAPRNMDLDLRAQNGGVSVTDVTGRMDLSTQNGGLHLEGVGGDVHGETQNGGLHVSLEGERWDGAGLDVRTQNGGVHMEIPTKYAAHLETGTVNGGVSIDFPVVVQGRIGRRIETDLNGGGTRIRATTTNGGVTILRR
ncbi:MAG: DUF4097 family beta strand repeat-containing protein [Gemmatimonadaceae bacterium]